MKQLTEKENYNKTRLIIIIPRMITGGAEVLVLYLLQKLNRTRYDINLVVFESGGELSKYIPNDVTVYNLKKNNRWDYFKISCKLVRLIKKISPKIVYSRMWYSTSVVGLTSLLTFQKFIFIANEEHNHKQDILSSDPFKLLKKIFMNLFHKFPHKVIVPTKGVKADVVKSYRLNEKKVKVIYNSVDLPKVTKMVSQKNSYIQLPCDKPIIVTMGRLIKRKGHDSLIKAFEKINKDFDCRLIIIGKGQDEGRLKEIVASSDAANKIIFTGYLENPYSLIASSDIFVLSSLWEGFGNVIIEAMACGVPVISTDCPYGPNEIITNEVNGLLVPVGDVEAMAEAMLRLLKDEPLRNRLAHAGKKRAEDFNVEKMVAEYEKVFDEYAL